MRSMANPVDVAGMMESTGSAAPLHQRLWHKLIGHRTNDEFVVEHEDIFYHPDPFARTSRHKLDVYVPSETIWKSVPNGKLKPCIIFVHGGGWKRFSKRNRFTGVHQNVGRAFAKRGAVTFIPSYRLTTPSEVQLMIDHALVIGLLASLLVSFVPELRNWMTFFLSAASIGVSAIVRRRLSPGVEHPAHTQDVARAVAWVRLNAAKFGGDPDNITLVGHSAGAHICSMLMVEPEYLKEVSGPSPGQLAGLVAISGPYNATRMTESCLLQTFYLHPVFGHRSKWSQSFAVQRLEELGKQKRAGEGEPQTPLRRRKGVGGAEEKEKLHEIPPVLLLTVERDWGLDEHAVDFERILEKNGVHVRRKVVMGLNHFNTISAVGRPGHVAEEVMDLVANWALGVHSHDGKNENE
eukprot:jgi/Bigna1/85994/estExt_fgenesh1_pg.C_70210